MLPLTFIRPSFLLFYPLTIKRDSEPNNSETTVEEEEAIARFNEYSATKNDPLNANTLDNPNWDRFKNEKVSTLIKTTLPRRTRPIGTSVIPPLGKELSLAQNIADQLEAIALKVVRRGH